ncbi:tubby-related protein 4-like [Antedon mediterranea]|uniref:tubby-related protein 4-like n=1 Tax=Antedon mediterranea TaxID=105859 RepID=UPI003AF925B2
MYAVLEQNPASRSDCCIRSLSWKGAVPASEKDKTHVRKRCVSEGWLASGNAKGIIGTTFTTSHCKKTTNSPTRTNFNLRGHNSEVVLVRWNEPFQKLATCDVDGIIFVWIKYEGRWSIELVNDRACQVSDFAWSHDGRTALICYKDGFVLVGSVAGQRYWSSMLQLDGRLTCGTWTPDDKQVILGTNSGQVMIMDIHGAIVLQSMLCEDREIRKIMWSVEKFRMINVIEEESDEKPERRRKKSNVAKRRSSKKHPAIMAVDIGNGDIQLMKSHDDITPILIRTGMKDTVMEWSKCGLFLAVGGVLEQNENNYVHFYNVYGRLRFSLDVNSQHPLSALTWGHDDKRIFVACGPLLHVAWVEKQIAPLQILCREVVVSIMKEEKAVSSLTLPGRLKNFVSERYYNTVKGCIPEPCKLREFISQPPPNNQRLHCTMVKAGEETSNSNPCYTLFLEYLGGLVPLLKGRRISKLCTEFVIYDPKAQNDVKLNNDEQGCLNDNKSVSNSCFQVSDDTKHVNTNGNMAEDNYDNLFIDNLPQHEKLVAVTSNIWGTKFKIHGLASFLPANMGQVNYKTSLLHLQPRQMSIALVQLTDQLQQNTDTALSLNSFSDDDDDSDEANDKIDLKNWQTPLKEVTVAPVNNFEKRKKQGDSKTKEEERQSTENYCDYEDNTTGSVNKVLLPTKKTDKSVHIKQGAIPKSSQRVLRTAAFLDDGDEVIENGAHAQLNLGLEDSDSEERWAQTKSKVCSKHLGIVNGHKKTLNKQRNNYVDHTSKTNGLLPDETHFPVGDPAGDDNVEIDTTETKQLIASGNTASNVPKQRYPIPFRNTKPGDVNSIKLKSSLQAAPDDTQKPVEINAKAQQPMSLNFEELLCVGVDSNGSKVSKKAKLIQEYSSSKAEVHFMHNKAPLWNENTQVYQLDFGGRVTQESAKNFQVEHNDKQVLQFGRIDGHAYTLDFQYPFSSIQAFAVALANITQRLK